MTMTCNRPFAHLSHETTQGACDGLLGPDRDTQCAHPGCDHDAATPDRAHALPVGLVTHLTLLGSDHGPALVLEAAAALWPTLVAAQESAAYDRGMTEAAAALYEPTTTTSVTLSTDDVDRVLQHDATQPGLYGIATRDCLTALGLLPKGWAPRG